MTGLAVKEKFNDLVARVNSSDGIVAAIGIAALILGILIDVFVVRLICLLVVLGAGVLVYAIMHSKQEEDGSISAAGGEEQNSKSYKNEMKKLIFDDFQPGPGGTFSVQDKPAVNPREQVQTSSPELPVRNQHPVSAVRIMERLKPEPQPAGREFQISDFFDIDSAIYKGEAEPRTEFDFLLNKVLALVKDVVYADTVAFFWANRERRQMVMEAHVTDIRSFMTSRRFSFGHDLVSKVAESGKPELLSDVNPVSEHELLPYYESPASIKSFIGVPVFYSKTSDQSLIDYPVAVIAVDSKVQDQFGEETLALLGQYTKLVSALIKAYNDKYDLLLDAELLKSIRRLQEKARNDFSMGTIIQSLAEETSKLVSLDVLSVVLYDEHKHVWLAKKVLDRGQEGTIRTDQEIEFPTSIVGETIQQNSHRLVDDLANAPLPRYFSGERPHRGGSFVSVPLSSLNKCYGALNLESRDKYNFSRQDIEMLYRLAENAASALEILYLQEVINEYVIVDDVTGAFSRKFFLQRMEEELNRADESGIELSLLFITVDKANEVASRYGDAGLERVMLTLAKAIRTSVRSYDIVGRYDHNRFGVILIDTAANDAYLWAEKIRKNVAGHVLSLDGKSFSITISTGVCGALDGMGKEEFVGNTIAVLNKAVDAGGNLVRVF